MEMMRAKIFIIDDHPIVIKSLELLINAQPNLRLCGYAGTACEALRLLPASSPDMVLVDLSLPDQCGLSLVQDIRLTYPRMRVLVASAHDEVMFAERALAAGAHGYIMKDADVEVWAKALQWVLAGHTYLSPNIRARIRRNRTANEPGACVSSRLSDREFEVLHLLGEGRTVRQISEMLSLGHHTVETYQSRLRDKLALENTHELLRYALLWSLQEDPHRRATIRSDPPATADDYSV